MQRCGRPVLPSASMCQSDVKSGLGICREGHGGGRREPLQRSAMMVARCYRSIGWATLAFERDFPAITLDVHLQDRGVVHEPIDGCQRHGLVGENFPHSPKGWLAVISRIGVGSDQLKQHTGLGLILTAH